MARLVHDRADEGVFRDTLTLDVAREMTARETAQHQGIRVSADTQRAQPDLRELEPEGRSAVLGDKRPEDVSAEAEMTLNAFVQYPDDFMSSGSSVQSSGPPNAGSYAPQSGAIFGVLKNSGVPSKNKSSCTNLLL